MEVTEVAEQPLKKQDLDQSVSALFFLKHFFLGKCSASWYNVFYCTTSFSHTGTDENIHQLELQTGSGVTGEKERTEEEYCVCCFRGKWKHVREN